MISNMKRVFYVGRLVNPEFGRVVRERPDVELIGLADASGPGEEAPTLSGAHAYQIGATRDELPLRWHGTAALLAHTPDLLVVSSNGAGYDTIDVDACTAAGILAVNQAGANAEAVAEHVLGFMLALSKRIGETDRRMRRESGIRRNDFTGRDIFGRTIGIVGFGHVGKRVAALCRTSFGMRVLAYDPYLDAARIAAGGAEKVTLQALLAQADFVSINCPLTAETRGMIGAAEYAAMQPHAYFITTARGFIHDEAALAAALREGSIAGAGLDVWEKEPPPPDHPLMAFDNVLVTPHTAGVTHEAREHLARIAAQQVLSILDGRRPERLLNPEAWPAYADRYRRIMGRGPLDA
jgi:D-3-phosphoglycerate dehydrogenase